MGGGSQSRRCSCKAAGGPRCGARGGLAQRASCLCNKASSRCLGANWRAAARHRRTPGALERTLFLARFSFGLHPPDESAFICPSDRQSSGETSGRTKRLSSGQTLLPEIQLGPILTVLLSVATISLILMMTKTTKLRTPVLLPPRLAPPRLAPLRLSAPRLAPPSPPLNVTHFSPPAPSRSRPDLVCSDLPPPAHRCTPPHRRRCPPRRSPLSTSTVIVAPPRLKMCASTIPSSRLLLPSQMQEGLRGSTGTRERTCRPGEDDLHGAVSQDKNCCVRCVGCSRKAHPSPVL